MNNEQLLINNFDSIIAQLHKHYQNPTKGILNELPKLSETLNALELYEATTSLDIISNYCYRMMRTSANVESYSKLMGSVSPLNPTKIYLNTFIQDLANTVSVLFTDTNFNLKCSVCEENIVATVDSEYLALAIYQLISNSCAFSPTDSTITIRMLTNNNTVNIIVADEGDGIPADELELIFNPFYSKHSGSHTVEGIGLGLPIVKQIATLMGGSVLISSGSCKGTIITFSFPIVNDNTPTLTLKAGTSKYVTKKISPLYLQLSEICTTKFY